MCLDLCVFTSEFRKQGASFFHLRVKARVPVCVFCCKEKLPSNIRFVICLVRAIIVSFSVLGSTDNTINNKYDALNAEIIIISLSDCVVVQCLLYQHRIIQYGTLSLSNVTLDIIIMPHKKNRNKLILLQNKIIDGSIFITTVVTM